MKTMICLLFAWAAWATAQEESPNGRYVIEEVDGVSGEANANFKNKQTGKVLFSTMSSGWGNESFYALQWSPDSRFLAVVSRGTKTTSGIEIFSFSGDAVGEIKLPDYWLNILGRHNLVRGGRSEWVNKVQWTGNDTLTFLASGTWVDGADGSLDNWYTYQVSLQIYSDRAVLTDMKPMPVEKSPWGETIKEPLPAPTPPH